MAQSKTNLFDPSLTSLTVIFKAMAHPARLAILRYLAETRVCITGNIADELPLSRTTVNQHLTELKNAGLIQGTVEGVRVNYCLNPVKIKELEAMANSFFKEISLDLGFECNRETNK